MAIVPRVAERMVTVEEANEFIVQFGVWAGYRLRQVPTKERKRLLEAYAHRKVRTPFHLALLAMEEAGIKIKAKAASDSERNISRFFYEEDDPPEEEYNEGEEENA